MSSINQTSQSSNNLVNVVTIGGGTGSSTLLRGLKRYSDRIDIAAIVTTFDDGGSSGKLRSEFGVSALGDLRRCIAALLPPDVEASAIEWMLEHRFISDGPLHDHSLGNLMLLGMWQRSETLSDAIDDLADYLHLLGRVIPASDQPTTVCAELNDGTIIRGESAVGARNEALFGASEVYLDPSVTANETALDVLRSADVIVLGPGDLFTSVIPNLLPERVTAALIQSPGRILQICNIAPKAGETGGYAASDFARTINRYLNGVGPRATGERRVDAMIVNEFRNGSRRFVSAIAIDDRLYEEVETVLVRCVSDANDQRVHDSGLLASAVIEYIDMVF